MAEFSGKSYPLMIAFATFLFIFTQMLFHAESTTLRNERAIFDFTQVKDVSKWIEVSDTARDVGMSKAALVLQKTQIFQRAVLFTMLNPQPNGAGFAGVNYYSNWNLSEFNALVLRVRGQGQNTAYKMVLRHRNQNNEPHPTYEQFFEVNLNEFLTITLPLSEFSPYFRGRPVEDAPELDKSFISGIGLQIYGGVYSPRKQQGTSSLEIDWIKAVN